MKLLIENFKNFLTEGPMTRNLYHGSNKSFEFKNFNIDAGVGAIYLFVEKEPAQKFAEYAGGNQCTYTIKLNSSANIVDLINMNTPEAQEVKDYIMEKTKMTEEQWSEFIECVDYCMFDFLDYNEEFVAFLQEKGIHGLHFWDGLDEINEPKIKVVALLSTDIVESAEKECVINPLYEEKNPELHGNCGMFAMALLEESIRRGIKGTVIMIITDDDIEEEGDWGEDEYDIYHVGLKYKGKFYDARGEVSLKELGAFAPLALMSQHSEPIAGVDYFEFGYVIDEPQHLDVIRPLIQRNTNWSKTCDEYRSRAEKFWDDMGL